MPWTLYQSTDSGAPALSGQAGSLLEVLDACLVNGYGGKAAAGWGIAFSSGNKRVYRPGASAKARKVTVQVPSGAEGDFRGAKGITRPRPRVG